jgi:hypothetical protein
LEECHFLDPIRAWSVGGSLVFIDYQNPLESETDIAALVGQEKFKDNGRCGYVLKPPYSVTQGATPFPPASLCVHVLSVSWLPEVTSQGDSSRTSLTPRVTVEIRGLPQDNQQITTTTNGGPGRLDNPIWDEVKRALRIKKISHSLSPSLSPGLLSRYRRTRRCSSDLQASC